MAKIAFLTLWACLVFTGLPASMAKAEVGERKQYNKCLHDFTNEQLDLKTTVDAFRTSAATACLSKQKATKDETARDEISFGSSRSEAAKFAEEDIAEMLILVVERYADLLKTDTRLVD